MTEKNVILNTGWNFDNSYARLPEKLFTRQDPAPVRLPKLGILNDLLVTALGLNIKALRSDDGVEVLAGNRIPENFNIILLCSVNL
jgi:uncharacterized protein YdiU (UPF0061 family)